MVMSRCWRRLHEVFNVEKWRYLHAPCNFTLPIIDLYTNCALHTECEWPRALVYVSYLFDGCMALCMWMERIESTVTIKTNNTKTALMQKEKKERLAWRFGAAVSVFECACVYECGFVFIFVCAYFIYTWDTWCSRIFTLWISFFRIRAFHLRSLSISFAPEHTYTFVYCMSLARSVETFSRNAWTLSSLTECEQFFRWRSLVLSILVCLRWVITR